MVKPSRGLGREPFLHLVGDRLGRADHGEAAEAAQPLRELAHGQVLALAERDGALAAAHRSVALRDIVGQRLVRIELRGIVAERDRQRSDGVGVVHLAVEQVALLLRLLLGFAQHDEAGRHDRHVLGIAAGLLHAALHVGAKRLAGLHVRQRGEHHLGGFGGELAPDVGGAGLHDHRPALHRARDVERAFHRQVFALVVEHMHLVGIEEDAALDVADEGVVGPGIPQAGDDVIELARAP